MIFSSFPTGTDFLLISTEDKNAIDTPNFLAISNKRSVRSIGVFVRLCQMM